MTFQATTACALQLQAPTSLFILPFPCKALIRFTDGIAYQRLQQLHNEHTVPGMGWQALGLNFGEQLQHEEIQN